jgi:transcriptional regulator with XRE-family HTH domain
MTKRNAAAILAENVKRLMKLSPNTESDPKLGKLSKLAPKTINNVVQERHNTKLSTIEGIAEVFGLETYQLLMPIEEFEEEINFFRIAHAYNKGDERGRRLLVMAAKTAVDEAGENESGAKHAGESDGKRVGGSPGSPVVLARNPK